jgi:hypothetical protein
MKKGYWKYSAGGTALNHVVPPAVNKKIRCCTCCKRGCEELLWATGITAAITSLTFRIRTGIAAACITGYTGVAGFTGSGTPGGTGRTVKTGFTGTPAAFTIGTGGAGNRILGTSFNGTGLIP